MTMSIGQEKLPDYEPLAGFNDKRENAVTNSFDRERAELVLARFGAHNDGAGDRR
jgi:hypothetical protein